MENKHLSENSLHPSLIISLDGNVGVRKEVEKEGEKNEKRKRRKKRRNGDGSRKRK
jgi:hypothetical protein